MRENGVDSLYLFLHPGFSIVASLAHTEEFLATFHIRYYLRNATNFLYYWASEASPTLGCSIEISRDILLLCRYVCLSWSKKRRRKYVAKRVHAQSQYWAVKSDQ